VKLGAKIIEVHLMINRAESKTLFDKNEGGFDWAFSREPAELAKTIDLIRQYEAGQAPSYETQEEQNAALSTHGNVHFEPTEGEAKNRAYRPSLWVVSPIKAGEPFKFCAGKKNGNFDSIRPADGLDIIHTDEIEGQVAAFDIHPGQPLVWDMIKKSA
ncbi:MAG: SAF domain-containing protein, partial [Pseudomonadota bacterium]